MASLNGHEVWMAEAIVAARRAWGQTHPNPMVGAVIVERGKIVARGYHAQAGGPHAEVMALQHLGRRPSSDATLYVTLEPCSTIGKTGACTDVLLQAGVKHVVIGAEDPNPLHAGAGLAILRSAGVNVETGVLTEQCTDLNLIFHHRMTANTPFIAAKVAATLDGCVATRTWESQWITGAAARADVMRWRRYFPAIAVGSGTVQADNPQLTSRMDTEIWCPLRFVFDRTLATVNEPWPHVFADAYARRTIVVTAVDAPPAKRAVLDKLGIDVWALDAQDDALFFAAFRHKCVEADVYGVYFEPGPRMMQALIQAQAVDYLFHYQAPMVLADSNAPKAFTGRCPAQLSDALALIHLQRDILGEDVLTRGFLNYADK